MTNTEDMVRSALRDELAEVEVADWQPEPMRVRVRRRQRGRRAMVVLTAAVVATGVLGASGALLSGRDGGGTAVTAAAQTGALQAPAAPVSWPKVVVVQPGQHLSLGRTNWWMRLEPNEICTHDAPVYGSGPGCGGYSWAGDATGITMQYLGGLFNPVYNGSGRVARMTVEVNGKVYAATVVTLAGKPTFATGYLWGPALKESGKNFPLEGVKLVAYDAQGKVLASKTIGPTG